MALMTGLAIGAALGGGLLAGKKLSGKKQQQQQAQGPVTAPGPSTPTGQVPAPPIVNPGADMATAIGAGQRQRKRAALGGLTARPLPKPGNVGSAARPKTLIGY